MSTDRREAPLQADEAETLLGFLHHERDTFAWKTSGLADDQLRATLPPSEMTLGGMITHLAFVEDYWITYVLRGERPSEPFASADWEADPDFDWHLAAQISGEEGRTLLTEIQSTVDVVMRQALDEDGLDAVAAVDRHGEPPSLRWILTHLIREYARHNGHADLIRESIDGLKGD